MFDLFAAHDTGLIVDAFYIFLRIVEIVLEAFLLIVALNSLRLLHRIVLALQLDSRFVSSTEIKKAFDEVKGNHAT
jgi:hypothetical protein